MSGCDKGLANRVVLKNEWIKLYTVRNKTHFDLNTE